MGLNEKEGAMTESAQYPEKTRERTLVTSVGRRRAGSNPGHPSRRMRGLTLARALASPSAPSLARAAGVIDGGAGALNTLRKLEARDSILVTTGGPGAGASPEPAGLDTASPIVRTGGPK